MGSRFESSMARLAPMMALALMLAMLLPALLAFAKARSAYLPALAANRGLSPPQTAPHSAP